MEEWQANSNPRKKRQLIGAWGTLDHVVLRGVAHFERDSENIVQAGIMAAP
jgi:hypothetical protein